MGLQGRENVFVGGRELGAAEGAYRIAKNVEEARELLAWRVVLRDAFWAKLLLS